MRDKLIKPYGFESSTYKSKVSPDSISA